MSAEAGLLSVIGKYLYLPIAGLLGWFFKSMMSDIKAELQQSKAKDEEITNRISRLETELTRNYYDKQEIKEHIVDPLTKRMEAQDATLKSLSGMMTELIQDIGILKYALLEDEIKRK